MPVAADYRLASRPGSPRRCLSPIIIPMKNIIPRKKKPCRNVNKHVLAQRAHNDVSIQSNIDDISAELSTSISRGSDN